jgi:hypothetical protein
MRAYLGKGLLPFCQPLCILKKSGMMLYNVSKETNRDSQWNSLGVQARLLPVFPLVFRGGNSSCQLCQDLSMLADLKQSIQLPISEVTIFFPFLYNPDTQLRASISKCLHLIQVSSSQTKKHRHHLASTLDKMEIVALVPLFSAGS